MKGYVINRSSKWVHAMKRAIAPGGKVSLSELYAQYGTKYDIEEGRVFVDWLQNVKLKDQNKWKVVFNESEVENKDQVDNVNEVIEVKGDPDKNPRAMSIDDIVSLSVRKAREVLPKITNTKLLKQSLQQANQLSGKDSLCILIRKRIQTLSVAGA